MSNVDTNARQRYESARDSVVAHISALEALLDQPHDGLEASHARLQRGKFVLAVVGEFSSGKSFLLNALLEKFRFEEAGTSKQLVGLLATDINPSTATITELEYADRDEATALYEDGHRERIPLDRLNRFIAVGGGEAGTLHDATKDERQAPIHVLVQTNSPFLQRGFIVADTPGLASINPAHRRATLGFLPSADAVLYLIDTQQPFTEGDAAFLGIVRQYIDSMFIVQTKIDLWREPGSNGKATWETAYDRISSLAAIHAPGTYVYAVSAREYAEGILSKNSQLVEESRFPLFLAALDASLVRRTGRARLRRACQQAEIAARSAIAQIDNDRAMLSLDETALRARRAEIEPELAAMESRAQKERETLLSENDARSLTIGEQAHLLADNAEQQLLQAFDTADIARIRDRARLHILVDRIIAQAGSEFAQRVAKSSIAELREAVERSDGTFSLNDMAARAFGGDPGTSLWSGDVRAAIAATIVLEAVGGPAASLVHEIAGRFTSKHQDYMKRELTADLRGTIFPHFRESMLAFAATVASRVSEMYIQLATAVVTSAVQTRAERIGSIDRALASREANTTSAVDAQLRERRAQLEAELAAIYRAVEEFLEHEEEIAPADPGAEPVRVAHADPTLDPALYEKGLRPERWRVAVLGALRRGKSSVINAFAQTPVLTDDIAGIARFPIHVRYGETDAAYALSPDVSSWEEIPLDQTISAAATSPVLRLTPWKHPRELVLVHSPAFDSGEAHAEDLNLVVAASSSAVLCLFSRQLSDRELALYERVAELGKPMLFAHTIADNESAKERRNVVELAAHYLRERTIPGARIFTISAHEYMQALRERRAPAAWNEFPALIATIEGQAESHMARLARLERGSNPIPREQAEHPASKPGFLARLFKHS